jgi:hypothetical protein
MTSISGGNMKLNASAKLIAKNLRAAKLKWPARLNRGLASKLRELTQVHQLSVEAGDVTLIDGSWYVTHSGLLRIADLKKCFGIEVRPAAEFCDAAANRWIFKATVYRSSRCKGFVGYGDATPANVSPFVRGAEMRVAETRAVSRALRKAFGIGICSVEELGSFAGPLLPAAQSKKPAARAEPVNANGYHPLRDRLCLIIRQHQLDAALVKAYAADYCEVAELRQASREQVAVFAKHLAEYAENDREALICQLNSYAAKPVSSAKGVVDAADEQKAAGAA